MQTGKANVIIDGQFGSTGKGKLASYLALENDIACATCDFMSNAGHTYVDDNGKASVVCQIPSSFVNKDAVLCINAGAAITVSKLLEEIDEFMVHDRLLIHPHAVVITQEDRDYEAKTVKRVSSTLKGCGGALSRKVMRVAALAKDTPELAPWIHDTSKYVQNCLRTGGTVIVEGAQGFDLSLNHGNSYPYVTSRDVTTASMLNNAGVPIPYLGDVYGCLRTFPIRVGNVIENNEMVGYSGPIYDDQKEISWAELAEYCGSQLDLTERTTVTKKIRRVFTWSDTQFLRFVSMCAPTKLFLNFINHIDNSDYGKRSYSELSSRSKDFCAHLGGLSKKYFEDRFPIKYPVISHIGTGEKNGDMIVVGE